MTLGGSLPLLSGDTYLREALLVSPKLSYKIQVLIHSVKELFHSVKH